MESDSDSFKILDWQQTVKYEFGDIGHKFWDSIRNWEDLILFYCFITVKLDAYLPSIDSPLGSNYEYLKKVLNKEIIHPYWFVENIEGLAYAPSDDVLFDMMIDAQSKNERYKWWNFGWEKHVMPDTQYMINMIFFLDPNTPLIGMKLNDVYKLYPVVHRHSFLKLDSHCSPMWAKIKERIQAVHSTLIDDDLIELLMRWLWQRDRTMKNLIATITTLMEIEKTNANFMT